MNRGMSEPSNPTHTKLGVGESPCTNEDGMQRGRERRIQGKAERGTHTPTPEYSQNALIMHGYWVTG